VITVTRYGLAPSYRMQGPELESDRWNRDRRRSSFQHGLAQIPRWRNVLTQALNFAGCKCYCVIKDCRRISIGRFYQSRNQIKRSINEFMKVCNFSGDVFYHFSFIYLTGDQNHANAFRMPHLSYAEQTPINIVTLSLLAFQLRCLRDFSHNSVVPLNAQGISNKGFNFLINSHSSLLTSAR
jgi:hypothetical protein